MIREPLVRPATREDAIAIAARLRVKDAMAEIWKKQGRTREQAVAFTFDTSIEAWTWEVDGAPACMWGLSRASIAGGETLAWMLTTHAVEHHRRTFWTHCPKYLGELLCRAGTIEGYCDAHFAQSVRWLKKLGFEIGPAVAMGDLAFHHFKLGT